jgi:integrase
VGTLAQSVLDQYRDAEGLLFPARTKTVQPFNGFGVAKRKLDKLCDVPGWTLHDLRRTFKTNLSKLGVMPYISERLLNHISSRGELEDTYDLYKFLPEMRAAIDLWDTHLTRLLIMVNGDERRGTNAPSQYTA